MNEREALAEALRAHVSEVVTSRLHGRVIRDAFCACGWELPWDLAEREEALTDHRAEVLAALMAQARSDALREAADALDGQPPKLRAQYVATLRLYASEPWRLTGGPDDPTHGMNHAPFSEGTWLDPGFCAGCDALRAAASSHPTGNQP